MPGVPSGRGCEACRKQKKKCDLAKPACSRCARLDIPCQGAGQQRFKFVNKTSSASSSSSASASPSIRPEATTSTAIVRSRRQPPPRAIPSDPKALIAAHLVSRLRIDDARYEAICFGPFLRMLPGRIGSNCALDAAVDAFCCALANLHNRQLESDTYAALYSPDSRRAFARHGHALTTLRTALDDAALARAPETVCAIYLILITETMIGAETGRHVEAMSYILQALTQREVTTQFEQEMMSVMCFSVLMESLGNKRIRTDPWMAQLIERIEPLHLVQLIEGNLERAALAGVFPSLILRSFVHLADLVRNPVRRQEELRAAYAMRMRDWRRIKQSLEEMDQASAADQLETRTATPFKTRTIRMTQLATSSGVALVVNRILQSYDPLDVDLIETETTLVRSILDAGRTVLPLRPLGAAHARPALAVAWAVTGNPNHRAQAGEMLSLIKGAVPAIRSISSALFDEDGLAEARWWSVRFDEIDNAIGTTFETRRLEVAQGTPGCHVQ